MGSSSSVMVPILRAVGAARVREGRVEVGHARDAPRRERGRRAAALARPGHLHRLQVRAMAKLDAHIFSASPTLECDTSTMEPWRAGG